MAADPGFGGGFLVAALQGGFAFPRELVVTASFVVLSGMTCRGRGTYSRTATPSKTSPPNREAAPPHIPPGVTGVGSTFREITCRRRNSLPRGH